MKILGLGNAVIDVTANIEDDFLDTHEIKKGLCYESHISEVPKYLQTLKKLGVNTAYSAGGSAANTMICIAALGGQSSFSGFIGADKDGAFFKDSLALYDVDTKNMILRSNDETGKIFILVTPDCQRSFMSFHGASGSARPEDAHIQMIKDNDALYIEGFSLYSSAGYDMFKAATDIARAEGKLIIFNPCDANVVNEKADSVDDLMQRADIIIANRLEALAMTQTKTLDDALNTLSKLNKKCIVITDSANGAHIIEGDKLTHSPIQRTPTKIVNDNGAGDNFAGGFLFGYLQQGLSACDAAQIGHLCAGYILEQSASRPAQKDDLKKLLATL
jgi:sugar/nucleoside kinase (ribokinase family)